MQPPLIPGYAAVAWLPNTPTDLPCKVLQTPWLTGETDEGDGKVDETSNEMLYWIAFICDGKETDEGDGKVDETRNEMLYKIAFIFA